MWFDHAVRLLRALPFEQRVMLLYGASCWTDEKFQSTALESGHAAVKLLRALEPDEQTAALHEATIIPYPETRPKPAPRLTLVLNNENTGR